MLSRTAADAPTSVPKVVVAPAAVFALSSPVGTPPPDPWPRGVDLGDAQVLVYQPQVNSWTDNHLDFRAALAIRPSGTKAESFGVIFASTRTQVDKVLRTVTFENLQISNIDFPTLPNRGANYGPELAKELEAKGYRKLVGVEDAQKELGIQTQVPLLGYVFDETWAASHKDDLLALVLASRQAKDLLARSDAEWERLRPLMKAPDDATFSALRAGFRKGIPAHWGEAERADAAKLFDVMAKLGGEELIGKSADLQPGTFWPAVTY
jgi:hypothetical protein